MHKSKFTSTLLMPSTIKLRGHIDGVSMNDKFLYHSTIGALLNLVNTHLDIFFLKQVVTISSNSVVQPLFIGQPRRSVEIFKMYKFIWYTIRTTLLFQNKYIYRCRIDRLFRENLQYSLKIIRFYGQIRNNRMNR